MDKEQLEELKTISEQNCKKQFDLVNEITGNLENARIELERCRGDYRTYDNLLLNWHEDASSQFNEMDTFPTEYAKGLKKSNNMKVIK